MALYCEYENSTWKIVHKIRTQDFPTLRKFLFGILNKEKPYNPLFLPQTSSKSLQPFIKKNLKRIILNILLPKLKKNIYCAYMLAK